MKPRMFVWTCMFAFFLLATSVAADRFVNYTIVDSTSNPLTNVTVVGRVCTSSACGTLGGNISTWPSGTLNTGDVNTIQLVYPTELMNPNGYAIYFYKEGYIPYEENNDWFGTFSGDPQIMAPYKLQRKNGCNSPVSVSASVANGTVTIIPTFPAAISFTSNGVDAFDPGFQTFYEVDTNVTIFVFNGSTLVNQQTLTSSPVYSTNGTPVFQFTPNGTANFTVIAQTDPIDAQCVQSSKVLLNSTPTAFSVFFPSVTITGPATGSAFEQGALVTFTGNGTNGTGTNLTDAQLVWTSSINGMIGTGKNFSLSNLSAGTHTITLNGTNSQGFSATATISLTINASAGPTITLLTPANNTATTNTTINFTYTATDQTGIANCSILLDGTVNATNTAVPNGATTNFTVAGLAQGTHLWSIRCFDTLGNNATTENRTLIVDLTAPMFAGESVSPASPATYNYSGFHVFSINWTDASGVASVTFELDGTTFTVTNLTPLFQVNLSSRAAGNYTYRWNGTDTAGNTNTTGLLNYTVNKAASSLQMLLNGTDANMTAELGSVVNLTGIRVAGDPQNIQVFFNGTQVGNGTSPLTVLQTMTALGTFNATTKYLESQNFTASTDTNFITVIDTTAPTISAITTIPPSPTTYTAGATYQFRANVTDASTISTVLLEFNGTTNVTATSIGGGVFAANITDLAAGNYTFRWFANDTLGNLANSSVQNYTINPAASSVNLLLNGIDGNIFPVINESVNITGQIITPTSGTIDLLINGLVIQSGAAPQTNITSFSTNGTVNITVSFAGNANFTPASETHFAFVGGTPPIFNITPPNGSAINTSFFTLSFSTSASTSCKWSFSDVDFSSMTNNFTANGSGTGHSGTISGLTTPFGLKQLSLACTGDTATNNTDLSYNLTNILDFTTLLGTNTITTTIMTNSTINTSTLTNVTGNLSSITFSTLTGCTVINSTLSYVTASAPCSFINTTVDPSNTTGSNITGGDITNSNVTFSSSTNSNITNSNVNGSTINSSTITNSTASSTNITNSTLTNKSNVTGGSITSSTLTNTTTNGATVTNATLTNSNITNGTITSSTVTNSTLTNTDVSSGSNLTNVTATSSTIINSTLSNTVVVSANITNGTIFSGTITMPNGTVYNATASGATALTNVTNYPPVASFTVSTSSPTVGQSVTFTATSTDPNIPGSLNDSLTHTWTFGDGTNATGPAPSKSYSSAGTFNVTLTTTDAFGSSSTSTQTISVSSGGGGGGSGGGGGGGGIAAVTTATLSSVPQTFTMAKGSKVQFTYAGAQHSVTLNAIVPDKSVNITIASHPQNATVLENQTMKFDIDDDKKTYDLAVKLKDAFFSVAQIQLWLVNEPIPGISVAPTEKKETPKEEKKEEPTPEVKPEVKAESAVEANVTVEVTEKKPVSIPRWTITLVIVLVGLAAYFLVRKLFE